MKTTTYFYRLLLLLFVFLGLTYQKVQARDINIQGTVYTVDTLSHMKIGPGTYFTSLKLYTSLHQLRVYFAHVDATNPYISFNTVVGRDSLIGCEGTSTMAIRKTKPGEDYFVGTNGDFFSTSGDVGFPCHGVVTSSQVGRAVSNSSYFAFSGNQPMIDIFNFEGSSITAKGQTRVLNGFNKVRYENEIILYNTLQGTHTRSNNYGTELQVRLKEGASWQINTPTPLVIVKKYTSKGNNKIEPNCAVISGHGTGAAFLENLAAGDEITINPSIFPLSTTGTPQITSLLGGDRIILKEGIVQENDWASRHPRTAMGYSGNKKTVIFCVVDGRGISIGVTTKQLASIMKEAGATTALNLDGGGSSAIYVKELGVMNKTSDGRERAVSNGFYAINTAPVDAQVTEIAAYKQHLDLPRYAKYTPSFYGYNQYGTLVNVKMKNVKLSCPSSMGTILNDTTYIASGETGGVIKATLGDVSTHIYVDLTTDITPQLRLDEVIADAAHPYLIEVETKVGDHFMPIMPEALNWTVDEPLICKVEGGKLIGLKTGDTTITGTLGNHSVTQRVHVQIPSEEEVPICSFSKFSTWELKHISAIKNVSLSSEELPLSVDFTYNSGRAPYVELRKEMPLFGLPSAVKWVINTGDLDVTKALVSFKTANELSYTTYTFNTIPQQQDVTLEVKLDDLLEKMKDRSSYPITMKGIKFMLSSNTSGTTYQLKVKDYAVCYKTLGSGIQETNTRQNLWDIYPNPVTGNRLTLNYTGQEKESIPMTIELYTLTGQKVYTQKYPALRTTQIPVADFSEGWYLVHLVTAKECMTRKILIK